MGRYLLRRLVLIIPTLIGASLLVFVMMRLLPGDVVDLLIGSELTLSAEQRASLRAMLGVDQPWYSQYLTWVGGALTGDLGVSLRSSQPVTTLILQRLPVTVELALLAALISWVVAIPLGVIAATRRNSPTDLFANIVGLIGLALPNFWLATLLLLITSIVFRWQPSPQWVSPFEDLRTNLQQVIMPTLTLSAGMIAVTMRMMRSSMLEVLGQDYIRTAQAKGLGDRMVLISHAFKNAAIPVVTVMGVQVGNLLGGAVIIEQIFGLPGIGWLILNGIYQRDYPVVQGGVFFLAVAFVMINLLIDLTYAYLDPRIHYG
jgi:peptide/nickel transport system permease protein